MGILSLKQGLAADGYKSGRTLSRVLLLSALSFVSAPLLHGGPAHAQDVPLSLTFPVDCTLGETCFVQNYFDADPGPGIADYACSRASYDGHEGVDIRVPTMADIVADHSILAAAAGKVKAVRDGMDDQILTDDLRGEVRGRECGNGVVVDHGGGWETQYCHLRKGSVAVSPGDQVEAGERLGALGSSGLSEFPHLELSVRKDGVSLDPFTGRAADGLCGLDPSNLARGLWRALPDDVRPRSIFLEGGFVDRAVSPGEAVARNQALEPPRSDMAALVFFAHLANLRAGDVQEIELVGPQGVIISQTEDALPGSKASFVIFAGRRTPEQGWPLGTYTGLYRLTRGGRTILEETVTARITE